MQTDQNTGDPILRWYELEGIADADLGEPTLRLILQPSFDPDVSISFFGPFETPRVLVVASPRNHFTWLSAKIRTVEQAFRVSSQDQFLDHVGGGRS